MLIKDINLGLLIFINNGIKNKKGGTILLMTVLILAGILTVTLTAGEIVRIGLIMGRTQVHSTKAFFAGETGIEQILWETRINGFDPSGCNADDYIHFGPPVTCDSNFEEYPLYNASYIVKYITDNPEITFHSYGSYENMQRRVEISY